MKIAIPINGNKLSMHFGHCEKFAFIEVDEANKRITARNDIPAPPHEPGLLPKWVRENGASIVITGGMGQRAKNLFESQQIKVITGCIKENPVEIVNDFINNNLQTGANACDH
ncbi:MAG: NifB/NifX family molybdenum-iron cluster-binding protein [Oligoflexia bacterium]|nr:NifB/NifX family molybdenum-iron cluster-binding protein [Oligoflexia bacterium]